MSLALGNMFRYAIKTESELVTLEQELRHVQDYVAIQSIRFDNRFHLSVTIPEELYELKVLKLTCSRWWKMHFATVFIIAPVVIRLRFTDM